MTVVERFLAEAVAGKEETAVASVEDGEREHPIQARGKIRAPFLVAVDQCLRIGVIGGEAMAVGDQLMAEVDVVVDLPVVDDRDRAVFVPHRLATSGQIQDREAPVPQMHSSLGVDEEAFPIRSTVAQDPRRPLQVLAVASADESAKAAHRERRRS